MEQQFSEFSIETNSNFLNFFQNLPIIFWINNHFILYVYTVCQISKHTMHFSNQHWHSAAGIEGQQETRWTQIKRILPSVNNSLAQSNRGVLFISTLTQTHYCSFHISLSKAFWRLLFYYLFFKTETFMMCVNVFYIAGTKFQLDPTKDKDFPNWPTL